MSDEPTEPPGVAGENTVEYRIVSKAPKNIQEEIEFRRSALNRAAIKFKTTHPLYKIDDITDMVINEIRRFGNQAVYNILVSYWKKEADQV